ncbi:MAG: trimeric intracellular cation channel family protein [Cytophagaceae bacterium]|nr:trimeric intracellular cation channel family protein [Cytophagaceae bacterium]
MDIIYILDLIGTFAFAVSGTISGTEKKLDLFGGAVIAFVTAIGGGTLRDLLIGSRPVHWITDLNYSYAIFLAIILSYLLKASILKYKKTMFLFDAIGIGIFTIIGVQKTLSFGLMPIIAIMMGTISAVFGGVIRDILCNRIPSILRKEIYATACVIGAILFLILDCFLLNMNVTISITILTIIVIRIFAIKKGWSLPVLY